MIKKILGGLAAVLVALLAAFLWGASGKSSIQDALEQSTLRGDLLEARSAVLTARIALYNTNFGDASRSLEEARAVVERAVQRLHMLGRESEAKQLEAAIVPVREAQQLAGKLDLGANSRAADATKMIDSVLQALPSP
ncbi:MAG TPA: hypothetical protein VM818_22915 [Vicinamibacterales bacterium]|jgi:hypothetical protein|nr:hypothetical protein [Vicinamibacterales bacterium]